MSTREAIAHTLPFLERHVVICANGYISRWASAAGDRPAHFYMIGSMGLAASIGLGVALARPEQAVAVLDGDGNVLMNLGALAMIGATGPERFLHVCFDNGVYASTGNQPTISHRVHLEKVAGAAGYRRVARVCDAAGLRNGLERFVDAGGPGFLLVETSADSETPAARIALSPKELTARFRAALGSGL